MSFIEDYRKHLHLIGIRINPMLLFFTGFVVVAVSALLSLVFHELLFFLIGLVIADFIVFYPYYKAVKTVASIEENLADALKQIASTLQAGGTFEMALREVVNADYGPLSKQFRYVLNDLQGGSVIDIALGRFAERVPSDLVRRTVTIIIDAFHAGGGLAKVLEDVAEDARQTYRLMEERKAKTTMQSMFIVVSAVVLFPFIVGAAFGIMDFFKRMGKTFAGTQILSAEKYADMVSAMDIIQLFLTAYVLFQAALSSLMISTMREGRVLAGIRFAPVFMLVAYLILRGTTALVAGMLGG